uniref:PDZ domain-containing protein n=1 Tax=Meloidogyne floridensis TaxID=298350 RepID=A0A915PAI4_9BILA
MSEFEHQSGKPLDCLCMALKIYKQEVILRSGEKIYKIGMSIGGGIDQDCSKSIYKDNGIYVTQVEPDSPAQKAGLKVHDKLLQVNRIDYTMITHSRAVKYLSKDAVLDVLVARSKEG